MEYSERNFRLTRCGHCGSVADKYIEFELLLVLIDIVLHRKAAYRHLMFNRYHPIVAEVTPPSSLTTHNTCLCIYIDLVLAESSEVDALCCDFYQCCFEVAGAATHPVQAQKHCLDPACDNVELTGGLRFYPVYNGLGILFVWISPHGELVCEVAHSPLLVGALPRGLPAHRHRSAHFRRGTRFVGTAQLVNLLDAVLLVCREHEHAVGGAGAGTAAGRRTKVLYTARILSPRRSLDAWRIHVTPFWLCLRCG